MVKDNKARDTVKAVGLSILFYFIRNTTASALQQQGKYYTSTVQLKFANMACRNLLGFPGVYIGLSEYYLRLLVSTVSGYFLYRTFTIRYPFLLKFC